MSDMSAKDYREMLALILGSAAGTPVHSTLPSERDFSVGSHLDGLADWSIIARRYVRDRLADAVDEAREAAQVEGRDFFCAVLPRKGGSLGRSYVVTDLEVFTRLLARDSERPL